MPAKHPFGSAIPNFLRSQINERGYATLKELPKEAKAEPIFQSFDEVIAFTKNPKSEAKVRETDLAIVEYIRAHPSPVVDDTVQLKMIRNSFRDYEIHSYQYFEGVNGFVSERCNLPLCVRGFWRKMESFLKICDQAILPLVTKSGERRGFQTILKVWKYTPVATNNFLIPIHYDRSVFTTIVATKNPKSERLLIGPPGDGTDIVELSKTFYSLKVHRPTVSDFPLFFPGLHAFDSFGFHPTAHAVEQVEEENLNQSRFSLVYFIVPFSGISTNRNYVAAEK